MKTCIVTFYNNTNYGGALNAYALGLAVSAFSDVSYLNVEYNGVIEKLRWNVLSVISLPTDKESRKRFVKRITGIKEKREQPIQRIPENIVKQTVEKFHFLFSDFKLINVQKKDLENIGKDYDLFLVGSDQVWNPLLTRYNKHFLLDFVKQSSKCSCYAPSIGLSELPKWARFGYGKELTKFKDLSCREDNGCKIINQLTGKYVEHVLDPVFLISPSIWGGMAEKSDVKETNYILVYAAQESNMGALRDIVKKYNKEGLQVVEIFSNIGMNKKSIGPEEWLYLLKNARYVVSDSFHAFAFSIIFRKNSIIVVCDELLGSRIVELAQMIGIEKRYSDGVISYCCMESADLLEKINIDQSKCYLRRIFHAN